MPPSIIASERPAEASASRFQHAQFKMRHLVLLVELGRHGSIMRAAKAANLSQPSASKLLTELERSMGVTLFDRLPRGITPTWYGKVLIRRAGAALSELNAAHQEVMLLRTGVHGHVAIGSVLTPASTVVPQAINALKALHPAIRVMLSVDESGPLLERLRAGKLDIVMGRIPDSDSVDELQFVPVADESHCLVARAGHPWVGRQDLDMASVAAARWLLPPAGGILRARLVALFLAHGLEQPKDTIETTSLAAIPPLLAGSDAVVALPRELVQTHLDAGILAVLPFALALRGDMYGIITRKNHQLAPASAAMLDILRNVAAARAGWSLN